ncbi:hypothetical protein TrST_g4001 [Triparma strigata]|uniref:Uncharacterized protein n=1 Tax=Triparma strigata TaxID=1606541 RepID=A0A9W7ANZ5_9STRA|nr:hypothetical protein TrST_g4001 [Triparma strigata]
MVGLLEGMDTTKLGGTMRLGSFAATATTEGQATTHDEGSTETAPTTASPQPKPPLHRHRKPARHHKYTDSSKLEIMATPSDVRRTLLLALNTISCDSFLPKNNVKGAVR